MSSFQQIAQLSGTGNSTRRPAYIGIHARDESTRVLYTSSGCYDAIGFPAEAMVNQRAKDFLVDHFDPDDYLRLIESCVDGTPQDKENDEANVYVFYVNVRAADGSAVLHRATTFKCDNCILYIGMSFPDVPYREQHELTAQMLDG
ncbi:hypothetical protein H4R19_003584, partial [Coemansia spiralis]